MSYTSVFGGTTIYPSDVSYLPLALAVNTTLEWPLEASGDVAVAARIIGVTPASAGLSVIMPDATRTGTGQSVLFNNMGATHSFTVKDDAGSVLATVAVGTQWQIYLTDNTTAAGTWEVYQMGASTATVQASALAGPGLMVVGSQLAQAALFTQFTTNLSPTAANRATMYVYTGTGAATLTLPTASTVDNKYFIRVRNQGTGVVLIDPSGTDLINGVTGLNLAPEDSAMIICDGAANWYTVGLGQNAEFTFDFTSIPVGGGTYTLSGAQLNRIAYRFTGNLLSDQIIIVPDTVQQYWIDNRTTGNFTLGLKTASQTLPTLVNQNASAITYCDGTEVVLADTSTLSLPVAVVQGGTGATTPTGARANLGISPYGDLLVTAANSSAAQSVLFPNPITNGQMLIGNAATPGFAQTTLTAGTGIAILNGPGSVTITSTGSPAPGTVYSQLFSGTGSQTAFTLAYQPYSEDNTQVYINGVYQQKNTYSLSGFTLTFSTAPVLGTNNIEVIVIQVVPIGATTANLVSFAPSGTISATNVQTAIVEVVTDLASTDAGKGASLVGTSDGSTVQNKLVFFTNWLPTLESGGSSGTASENTVRIQGKIDALSALGGGILKLNEAAIEIDAGLTLPDNVSVEGPGQKNCLITNTYVSTYTGAGTQFARCHIFLPGNFHPAYTQQFAGNINSKAINAVVTGDTKATLTAAGDASGYAVGDLVVFFTTASYSNGLQNIYAYMCVREVLKISGADLYLDNPFFDDIASGYAYNLRTGAITGLDGYGSAKKLYTWAGGEMGGFSVQTPGYWIGYTATYKSMFNDIDVQKSQAIVYGNFFQHTQFSNVSGLFGNRFAEISLNSENVSVRNFTAASDPSNPAVTAKIGIGVQENSTSVQFANGYIDVSGITAAQNIVQSYNADNVTFDNIRIHQGSATYVGSVLTIGDPITAANRRVSNNVIANLSWDGPCGLYATVINAATKNAVIDGSYKGTVSTGRAVQIGSASIGYPVLRNAIAPTAYFENGDLRLLNGLVSNFEASGPYIGNGTYALNTPNFAELANNVVQGIRTSKSPARRSGNTSLASTYTVTTTEADALAAAIGTGTLQRQDAITFSCNVALTGVAGSKTIKFKITDTTTPTTYTILQFVIPAATTGTVTISGTINVTAANAIYAQATCSDGTTVITNTPITTNLSAKAITLSISAIKASAGDGATIPAARIALTNPVQV